MTDGSWRGGEWPRNSEWGLHLSLEPSDLFCPEVEAPRGCSLALLSLRVPGAFSTYSQLSHSLLSGSCLPSLPSIQGQTKHKGFPARVIWLAAHTHWPQDLNRQAARIPTSHPANKISFSEITSSGCLLGHGVLPRDK